MLTIHPVFSIQDTLTDVLFQSRSGCASTRIPKDALTLTPSSLADRQLQSRVYEDVSEADILSASVGIIQDLGAKITETETDLGLVVGEKMRDATDPGQVAGAIILSILFGSSVAYDKQQKIKFSLVTTPVSSAKRNKRWLVRLTIIIKFGQDSLVRDYAYHSSSF
jgi:hypothetical protein